MSTLVYAQLTNVRESAPSGESTSTANPGLGTYVDALAALVPSEVLSLHALIIATLTDTTNTVIPADVPTLRAAFWGLIALSVILFAIPRLLGGSWDRYDWIRMLIAPAAFFAWTMLQRATAFDAAFPGMTGGARTVAALFLAVVLGLITTSLSTLADRKHPPATPALPGGPGPGQQAPH
ncbi:hypothetical protein ACMDCR_05225 [Labrys okinawensis]|uniref:hypothetical protein n=1 Tax=Labrys okinawensis TaxID=346911 RepID=UPI0039BD8AC5